MAVHVQRMAKYLGGMMFKLKKGKEDKEGEKGRERRRGKVSRKRE